MYTVGVYVETEDGKRHREIVNAEWRMEFHQADSLAAQYSAQYGPKRMYTAVNVKEIPTWEDWNEPDLG